MPWRNGGGTTTELVIEPAAASGERFLYRVSIADVASDGPFSRFDGYDRHIMLLSGAGMTIDCGPHGRIDLSTPFQPRAFSGDWEVSGTLVDGPVQDFNVMVDRQRASATLDVKVLDGAARTTPFPVSPGDVCIAHIIEGNQHMQGHTVVADEPFELSGIARVAIATISERARP